MEKKKKFSISLTTQILIATVGGIVFGALIGPWAENLKFIGDIFLRLIQMSVVLLVMSSVAAAVGGGDGKDVGKMGVHTIKWIVFFTAIAAVLGVVLSMLVKPGLGIDLSGAEEVTETAVEAASLQDTLLNFVPTNVVESMADGSMVPCIVFAIFFGVAMGAYTRQSGNRNMADWVIGLNKVITNIIKTVMYIAPIGIFCLQTKMEDAVTKFGVSRKVADFTGPITMSMNSCGAAMCYVTAIFFMAQSTGIEMTVYQMGMAILLSCLMCMGTISVPGGSVTVYTFLASSLGLPMDSIAVLIGIDWFAGMFRTLMNVDVDVMVGMLVAKKLGELDLDVYNDKKTVAYE